MPENRRRFSSTNNPDSSRGYPGEGSQRTAHALRDTSTGRGAQSAEKSARYGSSFEARFGRVILQHGIAAIPSALFHYQGEIGLKAQHVWFISYILSHKWDEDLPYPSLSNMARCTGVTLRNIQFIKSDLCRAGMLQVTDRFNSKGGRDSNAYDFSGLFTHLEELIAQDEDQPNRIGADLSTPDAQTNANPNEMDPSFVARFGRVIARRGVAAIPRAIFTHQKALELIPQQVWFVSYIFSFQWSTTLPYPSINKMVQHTGYSRAHLHTLKAELVDAGYLRLVHRTNGQGGQDSNAYDFSGLLDAIRAQLQPDETLTEDAPDRQLADTARGKNLFSPRRGQVAARQRASARTAALGDGRSSDPYESRHTGVYEVEQTGGYESQQIERYESEQTPPDEARLTPPVHHSSYTNMKPRRWGTTKPGSHELESKEEETNNNKDDSNHLSSKIKMTREEAQAASPKYSPYIAVVASDFSRELGDSIHEASNMKQALNLWQNSGLGEQEFVESMHEARKLTRKYQSRPTWDAMNNKMAYYFATLRDLVQQDRNGSDDRL